MKQLKLVYEFCALFFFLFKKNYFSSIHMFKKDKSKLFFITLTSKIIFKICLESMAIARQFNIDFKQIMYYTTRNTRFHQNLQQKLDKSTCIRSILSSVRNFSFTLLPLSISRSSTCNEQNRIYFSINKGTEGIQLLY